MLRLKVVRSWISRSGPRAQRQTTFVFRLSRAAIVELTLTRLAPDCRVVGKFRVAGRAGLNRVRFRGRIGRRVLRVGTYRVTARTLGPRAATPVRVHLVIVGHPNPRPAELATARAANACVAVEKRESAAVGAAVVPERPSGGESESVFKRVSGVLGTQFSKAVEIVQGVPTFLFFVLGLAIALLGLAALPGRAAPLRLHKLLAYHRELVALAGTVTLIGAAITYVVW